MPKLVKVKNYDLKKSFVGMSSSKEKFINTQSDKLRLWLRFNKKEIKELSGYEDVTTAYEGSAETRDDVIGKKTYNVARFDDSENTNGLVTFGSIINGLSFGDGYSTDTPFTYSFFYKRDTATASSAAPYLFAKTNGTINDTEVYCAYTHGSNRLDIYLLDNDSSNYIGRQFTLVTTVVNDRWAHIAITYDGSGNNTGIKAYADGTALSVSSNVSAGTYNAMHGEGSKLYIGARYDGAVEGDGYFAEFAVYAAELSLSEVRSIYYATTHEAYEIRSGFISNPSRVVLRQKDQTTGSYPSVLRMGDRDRKGNYKLHYDDQNIITFGQKLLDGFDFKVSERGRKTKDVNSNNWVFSSGMEIRREIIKAKDGSKGRNGALVFAGSPDSSGRWIRTKDKIRNPILRMQLIHGPYNTKQGLQLENPLVTEILKVQASLDASTWVDIKTITPTVDVNTIMSDYTMLIENKKTGEKEEKKVRRPKIEVKLDFADFEGFESDFYIRLVQTVTDNERKSVWAIDFIDITSRNQFVHLPFNIDLQDKVAEKVISGSLVEPNINSALKVKGSPKSNVSDFHITFGGGEKITPFDEETVYNDPSDEFFDDGVDPDIYPGFSSPLRDKTTIEVDLSPSTPTKFGMTNSLVRTFGSQNSHLDTSGDGHQLMVYWNVKLKRWEKIGRPVTFNNEVTPTTTTMKTMLEENCVGFSSYGTFLTGSSSESDATGSSDLSWMNDDILRAYNRPMDTFGFPYSGRYHATASQYTTARNLGITKPFLLEKLSLSFDMKNYFPNASAGSHPQSAIAYTNNYYLNPGLSRKILMHVPTFFILRQHEGSSQTTVTVVTGANATETIGYSEVIPGAFKLKSGSNNTTWVTDVRELITYGQHVLLLSQSDSISGSNHFEWLKPEDVLKTGLARDGSAIIGSDYHSSTGQYISMAYVKNVTGSYSINFPCRNTGVISPVAPYYVRNHTGSTNPTDDFAAIRLGRELGGRGDGSLTDSARALVNGFGAFKPSEPYTFSLSRNPTIPSSTAKGKGYNVTPVTTPDKDSIDLISPYIIMPEDKIVFGWQFPLNFRLSTETATIYDTAGDNTMHMTLFGNSKLHMYGSIIKDGKEFHEGLNQNLTSNAVHEIIGAEPAIDQFQIATRDQTTGSFIDTLHVGSIAGFYGNFILSKDVDVAPSIIEPQLLLAFSSPVRRIRLNSSNASLQTTNASLRKYASVTPFFSCKDTNRVFNDAKFYYGEFFDKKNAYSYRSNTWSTSVAAVRLNHLAAKGVVSGSTYGIMQTYYTLSTYPTRTSDGPKYYFNHKHYGHFSDFIKQGRDSKMVDDPSRTDDDIVTEPAVKTIFVSGTFEDNLNVRSFYQVYPEEVAGSSELQYQSSNVNLFATSSKPFIDGEGVSNRTYQSDFVVIDL